MSATKLHLTSVHGKRLGIAANGDLIINGQTVVTQDDTGVHALLQPSVASLNATGTLTAAQVASCLITSSTAAAVVGTLPTGAQLDTQVNTLNINECYDISIVNTGVTNTFTLAVGTGITIVGNAVIAAASSGRFRFVKTAAATYTVYRL